jgi:thioredoxin 1
MSAIPEVTTTSFQNDVLASDQPVLVDFWAPWCGPCKMLAPVIEEVAGTLVGKAKFVKLNTDENPNVAATYGISGIPTLILFKGGEVVDRIVGFVPKSAITSMISKHVVAA